MLTKCVRLFLYSYWFVRKPILKMDINKIFVVASDVNTSREKYFEFRKSLTHFDALISDDHFGQISSKSGKSTYPINSFEDGEFAQKPEKQKPCFRLETFSEFSHLIKILVNAPWGVL